MRRKDEPPKRSLMGQIPLEDEFKGVNAFRSVFHRLLHSAARYLPMFPSWRVSIHRLRGVRIGKSVFIGSDVFIDNTFPDSIMIEDYVTIISRSFIIGHSFVPLHFEQVFGRQGPSKQGVCLKKGCYIGAQSVVLPGVTVGECAVVGAGSVVTGDVAAFSIVAGAPAREIRKFDRKEIRYDQLV